MYKIDLTDISLQAYLGVYAFEQRDTQTVSVDVTLSFLEMPKGCISDKIDDVVCYAVLHKTLQNTAKKKRYQLIEHLGFELIQALTLTLKIPVDIRLSVHKNPPLDNMRLATFTMEKKWQT